MLQIHAALCDDKVQLLPHLQENIDNAFKAVGQTIQLHTFSNVHRLLSSIESNPTAYDILFLDIDMPDGNGIDVAEQLNRSGSTSLIIFLSGKEHLVFDSLRANPFRFLRKRKIQEDLVKAVPEIILELSRRMQLQDFFTLEIAGCYYKFYPMQIQYIETKDKYLNIVTANRTNYIRYSMADFEKNISASDFIRIHRRFLVNLHYIYSIEAKSLTLDSGITLPISRYRYQQVIETFHHTIFS